MTASSSVPGSAPYMARLFNTPRLVSQTFAHWSPGDNNPYLQVCHLMNKIKISTLNKDGDALANREIKK